MIHPEDLEFHAEASAQFTREFRDKFIKGAEEHARLGPFRKAPGKLRNMKDEVLDQWSYVCNLERLHNEIVKRLSTLVSTKALDAEIKDELLSIVHELRR